MPSSCFWACNYGHKKIGGGYPVFEYPVEQFIWTYHVSLFFFLSGYVYKITRKWESKGSRINFIVYKFVNLAVPYFTMSILYILINSMTAKTNTDFSASDIFLLWKNPIAQYWYIYALFMLLFLYVVLSKMLNDWLITILLVVVAYSRAFFPNFSIPIFGICLGHALCFGMGVCLKDIQMLSQKKILPILIGIHIATGAVVFSLKLENLAPFKDVMRVVGIITSVALIGKLSESESVKKFLLFINTWCFQIYLLHTIFTSATRIVLMKIGVDSFSIQLLAGILMGLAVPIFIGWLCSKTVIFNIFFFPTRTVNQLRKDKRKI